MAARSGITEQCDKCKKQIGVYGFKKHRRICDGSGKKPTHPNKYMVLADGTVQCPICDRFISKRGIGNHKKWHREGRKAWNKGKTKDTDFRIKAASLKLSGKPSAIKGTTLTAEAKAKISVGMKKAHTEGRGWLIGKTRNERKPSYPEQFFMNVIENEFADKNYQSEFRVSKFAIDFAWVKKKIAIEIDGQFHRLPEYVERDARKDKCLKANGWKLLRIPWKDMYADTKPWIELAKQHVHAQTGA